MAGCKCINQNAISYIWILFIPLYSMVVKCWNSSRNSMCCSLLFSPIFTYIRWQMNTLAEIGIYKIIQKTRLCFQYCKSNLNHKNITYFVSTFFLYFTWIYSLWPFIILFATILLLLLFDNINQFTFWTFNNWIRKSFSLHFLMRVSFKMMYT